MTQYEILNPNTMSLCDRCSQHVPAFTFIKNNQIWISKTCALHGTIENLVEKDANFYINYKYLKNDLTKVLDVVCLDITNRCNLKCPHCYQMPNNMSTDSSIETFINQIKVWKDKLPHNIVLMGAEPTTRNDLVELIEEINHVTNNTRSIIILSNGVYLSKLEYAKKFTKFDNLFWTIGLNHPDYQGPRVRERQEQGLKNCKELGLSLKNISYTLEGYHQLKYCLEEIQYFNKEKEYCDFFRIRVGADIGRCPDQNKMFMSDLVKNSQKIAIKEKWDWENLPELGIRAHYPVKINDVLIKLIQWPDITTIDLEEVQTEAWADILPNKPISPLVHQVILRDRLVNNNLPLLDTVPERYRMLSCITD